MKSSFLQEQSWRGFIFQGTHLEELDEKMAQGPSVAYIGFDATATSFHVGNLVQLMRLHHLQRHGHKPIVLMGGGTTKVGDPSGKDSVRKLLTDEEIQHNISSLKRILSKFVTFGEGPQDAILLNNDDWLSQLSYIPFLRDVGRHFSINRMVTFDSVKLRLEREQPLSFLEFNYMILQAYDFLELYKTYGCTLQLGGADQWGNIVSGVDLVRRMVQGEVYGLTSPLITTSTGEKMGKTAKGAIWLDEELLSPYDYWQFWRNVDDRDVGRFLKLFTFLSAEDISQLEALEGAELNQAKIRLADEATSFIHGSACLPSIHETVAQAFSGQRVADETLPHCYMNEPLSLVDVLYALGFSPSKSEARRLIQGGGARIDNQQVTDMGFLIHPPAEALMISAGKKKIGWVKKKA